MKEKKKVGILNVQWVDNYGAVLLAYALQVSIEKLGYQAEIIDYRPVSNELPKNFIGKIKSSFIKYGIKGVFIKAWNKFVKRKKAFSVNFSSEDKKKNFEVFRTDYLKRSKVYHEITVDDKLEYDIYVVGSDVVWKPDRILSKESDIYFLDFTEGLNCRRVAYAASIGTDNQEILESLKNKYKKMIQKFDCVSMRENASISFMQLLYGKEISWCIDPTLLLCREEYDNIIVQEMENQKCDEYIYVYLFEDNDSAFDMVNSYSRKRNLPVVCQCTSPDKIERLQEYSFNDGPVEFVNRIKNAKLVITDSFHGTVFSIIYQKEFFTISRGKISVRMQDLLTRLNLMERYVAEPCREVVNVSEVDYSHVEKIIDKWKKESIDYLNTALSGGRQ